jgi:putative transcriptional regulator
MKSGIGVALGILSLLASPNSAAADEDLVVGSVLVADRDLRDPNLSETVIVVVSYNEDGALGLVLNRRTDLPISRVFHEWPAAAGQSDPVFEGGPVEEDSTLALVRMAAAPPHAHEVIPGIYISSDERLMQTQMTSKSGPDRFRIFQGYAGWGPGQLEREIELGAWHVLKSRPAAVFDPDPDTLWTRLIHEMEVRIAQGVFISPGSLTGATMAG